MAKVRWTRNTAIEYLASNPNFIPNKPLSEYTDAYLKRTASKYQDAERSGRAAPTRAEIRGHARATVEHLAADKEHHILDQYRLFAPKNREIDQADLENLFKRAKRGRKLTDEVLVIITGVGIASPRFREKYKADEVHTYSYSMNLRNLKLTIDDLPDIFDFVADVSQLEWEEVHAISFAFPNPKS